MLRSGNESREETDGAFPIAYTSPPPRAPLNLGESGTLTRIGMDSRIFTAAQFFYLSSDSSGGGGEGLQ